MKCHVKETLSIVWSSDEENETTSSTQKAGGPPLDECSLARQRQNDTICFRGGQLQELLQKTTIINLPPPCSVKFLGASLDKEKNRLFARADEANPSNTLPLIKDSKHA
jgi:hypothetical protein